MNLTYFSSITTIFLMSVSCVGAQPEDKPKDSKFIPENLETCKKIYSPFIDPDRESYRGLYKRCISVYGSHRDSYIRGHKHAGIDLKGALIEKIYSIGTGVVVDIHLSFPHLTVVVAHKFSDEKIYYSTYKHIEELEVKVGDKVDQNSVIGRLFTKEELRISEFGVCHLHFEIKHDISDGGQASFASMSMADLNKFYLNPLVILKAFMNK